MHLFHWRLTDRTAEQKADSCHLFRDCVVLMWPSAWGVESHVHLKMCRATLHSLCLDYVISMKLSMSLRGQQSHCEPQQWKPCSRSSKPHGEQQMEQPHHCFRHSLACSGCRGMRDNSVHHHPEVSPLTPSLLTSESAFLKHAFREVTLGFCKGTVPGRGAPGRLRIPKSFEKKRNALGATRGSHLGEEHVK